MMKSLKVLTMVAAVAAVPCARAADLVKVDVPFKFVLAGQQLPSGVYLFAPSENSRIVQVYTRNYRHLALAVCVAAPAPMQQPGLVFHKHGDQHFLKAISIGSGLGVSLPTTQAEKVAEAAQGDGRVVVSGRP